MRSERIVLAAALGLALFGLSAGTPAGAMGPAPEQDTGGLFAVATETGVLLRWTLPDNRLPDGPFTVERTAPDGTVDRFEVPTPLPREVALAEGIVDGETYDEVVGILGPLPPTDDPDEAEAREMNRAMVALGSFVRPGWARLLGTIHADENLPVGTTWQYRVLATVDGQEVELGSDEATVGDVEPPPIPTGLAGEADETGIRLTWELPEEGFVVAYRVYRVDAAGTEENLVPDGLFVAPEPHPETGELMIPEVLLRDTEVEVNATYSYQVTAITLFGIETPRSEAVEVFFPDPTPIDLPGITGVDVRDLEIELFWAPAEDARITGFGVVRALDPEEEDPELLTPDPLPAGATRWTDTGVQGGESYYYGLVAYDAFGGVHGPGFLRATRGANLTPPSAPTGLALEATEESLLLSWNAPPETDLRGYQVLLVREDAGLDEPTHVLVTERFIEETTYELPVPPGTLDELVVVVRAVNTSFVEGAYSEPVRGRIIDVVPPAPPILDGIRAEEGQVVLSWGFTSDPDVVTYRVLRLVQGEDDFTPIREELTPDVTGITDTDVVAGLQHVYTVEAIDASGNVSERAAPLAATPFRLTRPAAPQGLVAALDDEGGVTIRWTAPPEGAGILFHVVERTTRTGDWAQVGDPLLGTVTSFTDPGGGAGTLYRVYAIDTAGNRSDASAEVRVEG